MNTAINWKEIKTASGTAEHIPNAIEELNSVAAEKRDAAYWKIENYAIVQSDLYEAAYYIIEPLIELLEREYTVDRTKPLRLLSEIALGGGGSEIIDPKDKLASTKSIQNACKEKMYDLKKRIAQIITKNEEEEEEKYFLLANIKSV